MFRKSLQKKKSAVQYLSICNEKWAFNYFKTQIEVSLYLSCYVADPLQYDSITYPSQVREGPVLLFPKSTVVLSLTSVKAEVRLIFSKRHISKTKKHNLYNTIFSSHSFSSVQRTHPTFPQGLPEKKKRVNISVYTYRDLLS